MNASRIFQQIRLWIYIGMFLTCLFYSWYVDSHSALPVVMAGLIMLLPFLEICRNATS